MATGLGSSKFKWLWGCVRSLQGELNGGLRLDLDCHHLKTQDTHPHLDSAYITLETMVLWSRLWCTKLPVPPLRLLQINMNSNLKIHAYHADMASSSKLTPHLNSQDCALGDSGRRRPAGRILRNKSVQPPLELSHVIRS